LALLDRSLGQRLNVRAKLKIEYRNPKEAKQNPQTPKTMAYQNWLFSGRWMLDVGRSAFLLPFWKGG
jgi:hypothetical protein